MWTKIRIKAIWKRSRAIKETIINTRWSPWRFNLVLSKRKKSEKLRQHRRDATKTQSGTATAREIKATSTRRNSCRPQWNSFLKIHNKTEAARCIKTNRTMTMDMKMMTMTTKFMEVTILTWSIWWTQMRSSIGLTSCKWRWIWRIQKISGVLFAWNLWRKWYAQESRSVGIYTAGHVSCNT